MFAKRFLIVAVAVCLLAGAAAADRAAPLSALAKMPVKEITIFKDGHAFVMHEGTMPTSSGGAVVMDYLPTPVVGTFWPYSAEKKAKLTAVVAGKRKVLVTRTALTLRELIEANATGAEVIITERPAGKEATARTYAAKILSVPVRSGEELEATSPPNGGEKLPQKGNLVMLATAEGTKVVDINRILDVTFKKPPVAKAANEEFRNLLTLKLDWGKAKPAATAKVGMMYLQKGVRWIPHYKIVIDGKGKAKVKLQATLINELTDLDDVTAHLVVGVPTFAFKDMVDPISLQRQMAQLSQYFRGGSAFASNFSNSIMTQSAAPSRRMPGRGRGSIDLGPEVAGSGRSEDLFIYTVEHITLKKGQRMVLPIAEFEMTYRDVYTLDIPFTAPPEMRRYIGNSRNAEIARLLAAAKVQHVIRLSNKSKAPLTTAPALILRDSRVLAQGMMTYTAIGAEVDLPVTVAVDVNVKKTDRETKRNADSVTWNGHRYSRIDLAGEIKITNHRDHDIELEVTRHVLGNVDKADHDGKPERVNVFEDTTFGRRWNWGSWPRWWSHFNGVGRITWKLKLAAGKDVKLGYDWHYYWRP